jgi:hypothetical protein
MTVYSIGPVPFKRFALCSMKLRASRRFPDHQQEAVCKVRGRLTVLERDLTKCQFSNHVHTPILSFRGSDEGSSIRNIPSHES